MLSADCCPLKLKFERQLNRARSADLVEVEGLSASRAAVAEIIHADTVHGEIGAAPVMAAGDFRVGDVAHVTEAGNARCQDKQRINGSRGRR